MAILTDLPNELLLSIIPDVSPVYIETFALSCKRIHYLCVDTIREYRFAKSELASLKETGLLRIILRNPRLAFYPTLVKLDTRHCLWDGYAPHDLHDEMDTQILQNHYADLLNAANTRHAVVPLLITRLLNVQKMEIGVTWCQNLQKIVSQIVEDSHEPGLTMKEPLALGRLQDVHIWTPNARHDNGMELAILLAMVPSLRKLSVCFMPGERPATYPSQHRPSGVTEMTIERRVDVSFLVEMVGRTIALQRFTYYINSYDNGVELQSRCLVEVLKHCAGQRLTYLNISSEQGRYSGLRREHLRQNHDDLSLGSLRDFTVLKTLTTFIDVFIKTRDHSLKDQYPWYMNGTGRVQRLISWLPASLETLVLHKGFDNWNKDVLRMLFRGLRNKKQARLPNLKLIVFVRFPKFDQVMSDDVRAGRREMGVKIRYTLYYCGWRCGPNCSQRLEELQDWEGRPWIEALGVCCEQWSRYG